MYIQYLNTHYLEKFEQSLRTHERLNNQEDRFIIPCQNKTVHVKSFKSTWCQTVPDGTIAESYHNFELRQTIV